MFFGSDAERVGMSDPFHIVDVFAQERYAGNQLAVVTDAGDLHRTKCSSTPPSIELRPTDRRAADGDVAGTLTPAAVIARWPPDAR